MYRVLLLEDPEVTIKLLTLKLLHSRNLYESYSVLDVQRPDNEAQIHITSSIQINP